MRSSCLVLVGLLAGCGGEKPSVAVQPAEVAPAPVPDAPAEAGTTAPAPEARPMALVFRVIREGGGGIDATINQVNPQGQASFYATVPSSGETALDKPCEAGQRFQAEPRV